MKIYYSKIAGKEDVSGDDPIEINPEELMGIFKAMGTHGFFGVDIGSQLSLQISKRKKTVEFGVLNKTTRVIDSAEGSAEEIGELLESFDGSEAVLKMARAKLTNWFRLDLDFDNLPKTTGAPPEYEWMRKDVKNVVFEATEAGLQNGLAGASNSKDTGNQHYLLFGKQEDPQHSWNSGMYFEFDDQSNGGVNIVTGVVVQSGRIVFMLKSGSRVEVGSATDAASWESFIAAVRESFPTQLRG
jgi:hypothetical protein